MKRTRLMRRFLAVALSLVLVGLVGSWVMAGSLIAPRPRAMGNPPANLPAVSIALASDSGASIAGWHIPSGAQEGVVVLLHPIRGSRLSMLQRARLLHAARYSVVMIDLQGHGESSGEHITMGSLERHDARAAVEYARREHSGEPVAVVGISLGGASALLASPLGIDALVLESVFPNVRAAVHNRVAIRLGPLSWIPAELLLIQLKLRLGLSPSDLRPIDGLAKANCPVFLISGDEDRSTTASETKEMFAAAREPKELWLVEGAAHEDLYREAPAEYEKRVLGFLEQHMRGTR